MEFSADLIDDRIWLGSIAAMKNTIALDGLNITHILSVIESDLPINENDNFIRKHVRVDDIETTNLLAEFDSCYDFIDKALSDSPDNNVLIHCLAGVSRSATIACMWLMRRYKLSANNALQRLRLARSVVHPIRSFIAQLYSYEQMNYQFDINHELYKGFLLECARNNYIDHDTEYEGIEKKHQLRQEFSNAFTLPYGHTTCIVKNTYTCRQCHTELFTNADLLKHTEGVGLYNWFIKYGDDELYKMSNKVECHQKLFTNYLKWLMSQIDTPENSHNGFIKCPKCSEILGNYDLCGAKCPCGRWITPAFYFHTDKIEQNEITELNIETKKVST